MYSNKPFLPPQNIEAEQYVLGSIFIDNNSINEIIDTIKEDDFYKPEHQKIFSVMREMYNKQEPIDVITLNNNLKIKNLLENVGGTQYITLLASFTPTSAGISHYAKIVSDNYILRKIIVFGNMIVSEAKESHENVNTFIDQIGGNFYDLIVKNQKHSLTHIKKSLAKTINFIDEKNKRYEFDGIETGFRDLDLALCGGFNGGELIVIGGRPAMGKSAFAVNIIENIINSSNKRIALFSLEMSERQNIIRILCSMCGINTRFIKTGEITNDQFKKLCSAAEILSHSNLYIDDTSGNYQTIESIRSKCQKIRVESGLDLIVIDYLQLIGSGKNEKIREQEVAKMSSGLKCLAKDFNVPIILLSQLNRSLESRPDKRPKLSDLRESGAIEQDADIVLFLYRDEVYNPNNYSNKGIAELIIAKNREGEICTIPLFFKKEITRFINTEV